MKFLFELRRFIYDNLSTFAGMFETGFISVIVPLKLEWEPVYALPCSGKGQEAGNELGGGGRARRDMDAGDDCGRSVGVGSIVKVKFAGKGYAAVVSGVNVSPTADPGKVKPIEEVLDIPCVSAEEIELWRKIASYYMCSVGEVYKMAYTNVRTVVSDLRRTNAEIARRQRFLEKERDKARESRLRRIDRLETRLTTKQEQLGKARLERVRERLRTEIDNIAEEILCLTEEEDMKKSPGPDEDFFKTISEAENESPLREEIRSFSGSISLTEAQAAAYEGVKAAFREGRPALLQGVTGSGKTEIYMKLAQETLLFGKNVLYLVPEIALSRQLEERLSNHFFMCLKCFHSGLGAAEKTGVVSMVADRSRPYIVLGTRSALFLPHHDLGLVIVDEEHDGSYKQDSPAPRYNGRDVALMLASLQRADILLGSATPSFESLYNCACGRFRQVFLGERFHGGGETEVVVIDTNAERKKRGMVGSISRKLIGLIKETLDSGSQAMVLRARKSYATTVQCSECGAIIRCPHCNVSLNWQKSRGRLVCNHCGYVRAWSEHIPHLRPDNPSECDGQLVAFGAGTERIEEELRSIFPERTVARLDSDTSARAGWQKKVLKDFADKKIDILLGTQMLTKGFDFDNLSLVAVLQADSLLGQQDFRADEKALQILEQFRGRCSRRGQKGIFVIQTAQPEHPVYQMLLNESRSPGESPYNEPPTAGPHTASAYRTELLRERQTFRYPPYTRIVNIILKDSIPDRLERLAGILSLMLRSAGAIPGDGVEVTPPYAPAVDKVRDEYIRIIRISLPKDRMLSANKAAIAGIVRGFASERKYEGHITIDVDPS